mgnify:CR=1 FL=1
MYAFTFLFIRFKVLHLLTYNFKFFVLFYLIDWFLDRDILAKSLALALMAKSLALALMAKSLALALALMAQSLALALALGV